MSTEQIIEKIGEEVGVQLLQSAPTIITKTANAVAQTAGQFVVGAGGSVVVAHPTIAAIATAVALHPIVALAGAVGVVTAIGAAVEALCDE